MSTGYRPRPEAAIDPGGEGGIIMKGHSSPVTITEVVLIVDDDTELRLPATARDENHLFRTDSAGYSATGKVSINGNRFQVNVNIVKLGSKPAN